MADKPRRGRPPLPPGVARKERLEIRASAAELALARQAAHRAGMEVTTWIRQLWMTAASS